MPRPRLPQAKAEASGAAMKNPQRFRDRETPKRTRPVGEPYARMTEDERGYWHEFVAEAPWLHSAHRALLRLACILSARMDGEDGLPISGMQSLSAVLSKLGMTPTDETKVNHGGDGESADPAEEFFRSH